MSGRKLVAIISEAASTGPAPEALDAVPTTVILHPVVGLKFHDVLDREGAPGVYVRAEARGHHIRGCLHR